MRIEAIKVGSRVRKDLGDMDSLVKSIETVGLLQPVVIDQNLNLVAGFRRLEACKRLKMAFIPALIAKRVDDAERHLLAERDENTCRKDFTPSELVSMGEALEAIERPEAEKRQGTRTDLHSGKFPECSKGQTRDKVGRALGVSGKTYQTAKKVVDAAKSDPNLKPIVEEMDRTGNVSGARKKVLLHQRRLAARQDVPSGGGFFTDLSDIKEKFACLYVDPPWQYGNQTTRAATSNHYEGLSVEDLCKMPIQNLCAENAHLHLWTTNGFLFEARTVMEAWGFTYKSCFVWCKPQIGIGNYWRVSHEFLLLGVRGKMTSISKSLRSWAEIDRGKHSAKPDEVRTMVEQMSPGPRLEMFGRKRVTGWTVFGNELTK